MNDGNVRNEPNRPLARRLLKNVVFCLGIMLLMLGGCSPVGNGEAMFRADLQRTGVFPAGGPTAIDGMAWSFETDDTLRSSPVMSGGTVYVGSYDNHLYAVDVETGTEQWAFETGDAVQSSPSVYKGTVYVGSLGGHLYAIE